MPTSYYPCKDTKASLILLLLGVLISLKNRNFRQLNDFNKRMGTVLSTSVDTKQTFVSYHAGFMLIILFQTQAMSVNIVNVSIESLGVTIWNHF